MGRPNRISSQTTKTFSERLSDLVEAEKKDTGKRQKEIAFDIGVSSGTLSEWCSDQKTPTIDALPKLAAYFHVSSDWLIGLSDVKSPDSSVQCVQRMTGLSERATQCLSMFKSATRKRSPKFIIKAAPEVFLGFYLKY